ncbi:MAG: sulfotransferase [Candidatus Woesearchaeota archaeon]
MIDSTFLSIASNKNQKKARLVCKNLNGLVYLTDIFQEIYSDSTFICIIRNPLVLLESHLRRGANLEQFIDLFHHVRSKMITYRRRYSNYMIVKYEDIIDSPFKMMKKIYKFANLNLQQVKQVRFQLKSTVKSDGSIEDLDNRDRNLV